MRRIGRLCRSVALLTAVTLGTGGCLGWGTQEGPLPADHESATTNITFWTPFSGGDGLYMIDLVKRYNQENRDGVTVNLINNKSEDYYTKLTTSIVTEEAPDVAVVHASQFARLQAAGFLDSIDGEADSAGIRWEDFHPAVVDSTVADGRHYAVPLDTHFYVMYYNKRWLREAELLTGDGKPKLDPGEEGFTRFLQRVRERVPQEVAPLAMPSVRIDAYWLWWSLYNQIDGGGVMLTDDGRPALQEAAALRALTYVEGLYDSGLIPPDISDAVKLFSEGQAAVLFLGVWGTGIFEKVPELDFGVVPFPTLYDRPASWGDSHTFAFPAGTQKNREKRVAALSFANWVARHGADWAKAGHIPAAFHAVDSPDFRALRHRSDYAAAAEYTAYYPKSPKLGLIHAGAQRSFELMLAGKRTPGEVLAELKRTIEENAGEQGP
ncbi:ABC transporter substrate-binding protein [Paenibacillus mucilaginosus]|uniref:Extracellular solute-binding protein family 1 n=1 Tax=Paenibacillus mucilaginosus (strain KNP414) TaxID=1036673 RepID=F8F573_PAEMK|nr:extracellular solute-binding protein [Paenibacillus mucilaginosus]AEI40803.1 extracellular solute-binding protein family 1 [Paenibacillus mucilaginosus KNP414]MCG7211724.1 extracellular solute-binding protein [Paenibacillus mucilaginosus]WDM29920.1 extracellular solute-binding protein [Paenibacillus mucilaginosus]